MLFLFHALILKQHPIITHIEKATNMLVLSSNLALAWHMARLTNIPIHSDKGKLFSCV